MTSPRILQDYLRAGRLTLPCGDLVGANFKMHINSAVLGFSPFKDHDVLRKTAVLYNDKFPHSSMQCLGWIDGEVLATQAPRELPGFLDNFLGERAIGFWATTEDSSSRRTASSPAARAANRSWITASIALRMQRKSTKR